MVHQTSSLLRGIFFDGGEESNFKDFWNPATITHSETQEVHLRWPSLKYRETGGMQKEN